MTRPLIFDDTALVALFDAQPRVYALWTAAEENDVQVLLPTAAIYAANLILKATEASWFGVLHVSNVIVLDLTASVALAAAGFGDELTVAHTYVEAVASDATIITARNGAYGPARAITF